jgi:hypothetical protein
MDSHRRFYRCFIWENLHEELNVDDKAFSTSLPFALLTVSASSAHAWSVGLNW